MSFSRTITNTFFCSSQTFARSLSKRSIGRPRPPWFGMHRFSTSNRSGARPGSHSLTTFIWPEMASTEPQARAWSTVRGVRSIRQSGSLNQTLLCRK